MLDKQSYAVLYGTLKKYLSLLSEHSTFYRRLDVRDSIIGAVRGEVPLFLFLADKAGFKDEAKSILSKFQETYFVHDLLEETDEVDYASKDFTELNDEVNYLKVCIRNICNIDLDNLDLQTLKQEEDAPIKNYDSSNYQKTPNSLVTFKNVLNEDIPFDPTVSKELGDFLLRSHAYERLNKDINDGSVYIYTSKPKINAVVKYLLIFLATMGVAISILLFLIVGYKSVKSSSDSTHHYAFLFPAVVGGAYFTYNIFSSCKSMKNDNFKYSFSKRDFIYSNIFLALVIFSMSMQGASSGLKMKWNGDMDEMFSCFLLIVSVLFTTTDVLAYFFLQPKKNTKLVDSILEQHMSDLSKGASF